jgi:hypothetical protein
MFAYSPSYTLLGIEKTIVNRIFPDFKIVKCLLITIRKCRNKVVCLVQVP